MNPSHFFTEFLDYPANWINSLKLGTEIRNSGISSKTFKIDHVIHPVRRGNEYVLTEY